jgi:GTP cyclohydrolase I
MEKQIGEILTALGENRHREGLQKTPQRVAESLRFLTSGYHENLQDILTEAVFTSTMSEMIVLQNIELYSLCEHHLLPFFGKCHVAYVPNGKIIGLSKLARIVDIFSKRLQVQENLTQQIAELILEATHSLGVGVIIEAQHLCMMMRGVQKQNSMMKTSVMLGLFREDPRTRAEFLSLVGTHTK